MNTRGFKKGKMCSYLRLLLVLLQVVVPEVSCDFENDRRLLEEYNSRLFVLCFLIKGMFLDLCLDMSFRCCQILH